MLWRRRGRWHLVQVKLVIWSQQALRLTTIGWQMSE
jgi:hypothetical protein